MWNCRLSVYNARPRPTAGDPYVASIRSMNTAESDGKPITLDEEAKGTTVTRCEDQGDPPNTGVRDVANSERDARNNSPPNTSNPHQRANERIDIPPWVACSST